MISFTVINPSHLFSSRIYNVFVGVLHPHAVVDPSSSCYKHRTMPTACRFRMYQGNGSTCPHARIRSSLISAKVRTLPLYALTSRCLPPHRFLHVGCIDVAIGLEKVTQGLARATSHRVLAPAAGTSPRYSIPFFQNLAQGVRLSEHVLQCTSSLRLSFRCTQRNITLFSPLAYPLLYAVGRTVPLEVLKLKGRRGEVGQTECE